MSKFVKKTRGAISLFLALLLLPLMSVASIFVDMSRLNLAQSMAASAGDLTVNTALTNYDSELKTLYGLFATAQNMDEMMEGLEDYYRQSIEAAGVDSYYAADFAKNLVTSMKEATGTDDLMNIQLSGLDVEIPQGAHLGNPAIMKNQIVEFMKYRAPVNLGMGLIDALSSMKNMTKQMDVVENKNAFYQQHQTMLGHIETAWKSIQKYQYKDASSGFPTGKYIETKANALTNNVDNVKTALDLTVRYLYDRSNFEDMDYSISLHYACPECGADSSKGAKSCEECEATWTLETGNYLWKTVWNGGTEKNVTSDYTKSRPATLAEVVKAYKNVREQLTKISNQGDTIVHITARNGNSQLSKERRIYLVCQMNRKGKTYIQDVKDLVQRMVHLNSALLTCEDENLTTTKLNATTLEIDDKGTINLYTDANNQLKSHMKTDGWGYIEIFNKGAGNAHNYYEQLDTFVADQEEAVKNKIQSAQKAASSFYNLIEEKVGDLTAAINSLSSARTMLDTTGSCTTTKATWSGSAQGLGDDTMGQHDLDEISELEKLIDYDKVNKLITRLEAAKTALNSVLKAIEGYTVCGTQWKDVSASATYKDVVDLIKPTYGGTISGITVENENSYKSVIDNIKAEVKTAVVPLTWAQAQGPDLSKDSPALYAWMYNNYYDPNMNYSDTTLKTADTSTAKDAAKDLESQKAPTHSSPENVSSSGSGVDRDMAPYLEAENGLPSTRWKGEKKELAKAEIKGSADEMMSSTTNDNFLKTIMNLAVNMGRDLRDNLYISEYIMTMFSYDTLEAEIFDENNTDSTRSYEAFYEQVEDKWKAKEAYANYAGMMKTQTKVPITPDMNYLYGEEVEYILYGTAGSAGVYATIYALRFGLNTVYAFMDAEINNITTSAATALFGTPPLTPLIPIAKIAMTVALALAESGWDLNELSKGKAIPLMKNKDTWIMKPSGIAGKVKEEAKIKLQEVGNKAIDKGYEVLNKALNATSEELDAIIASGEEGIGQLADAALATAQISLENYANTVLQKAVELCNQVNQEYMLKGTNTDTSVKFPGNNEDKANEVKTRLKNWIGAQTGDTPVVKEVRDIAYNYLVDNGSITTLFESIESQSVPGAAVDVLSNELNDIKENISRRIRSVANQAGTALGDMKDELEQELTEAAKEGADKLKATLANKLDDCFDQIPTSNGAPQGAANGLVSSLLSWRYSDYLRIFVVVGLYANEELMLLRTADVIERNMQHKNNEEALVTTTETVTKSRFFGLIKYKQEKQVTSISDDAFTLSKSYTYVKLKAHIQVKPLFMTLPFMADTVENQLTGTNWYEFTTTSILGY